MAEPLRRLSVFLASPNDLTEERGLAKDAIDTINRIVRIQGWHVELLVWEDARPASGRPQAIINKDVDACDLFIGLLWERWGQPSGTHSSGFEEEFERATKRRQDTGNPLIWLVFKKVDASKLRDPGSELKRVLEFRARQINQRELLFKECESSQEWRLKFFEWILQYIAELTQDRPPAGVDAAAAQVSGSGASSNPPLQSPEGPPSVRVLPGLVDATRVLQEVIAAGGDPRDAGALSDVQIVRLNLLSRNLMTRVDNRVLLDVIESNRLYNYRQDIEVMGDERWLIYRTLVSDRADIVPGWYWVRHLTAIELSRLLRIAAMSDGSPEVRERALLLLSDSGLHPSGPDTDRVTFWEDVISDDSADVRRAALRYLGNVGTIGELSIIESARDDRELQVRTDASSARFHILARHDLSAAFNLALSGDRGVDVRTLGERVQAVSTEELQAALASGSADVRGLAVSELKRRRRLTVELATSLLGDASETVRGLAFEELIDRGVPVSEDQLRKAFKEAGPRTLLSIDTSREHVNVDHMIAKLLSTYSPEKLNDAAQWFSLSGALAYKVLGLRHFDKVAERIRHDLKDQFTSHKAAWEAKAKQELGQEGFAALGERLRGELSDFLTNRFVAAGLEVLGENGEMADAEIARRYLPSKVEAVQLAGMKILKRYGSSTDVEGLLQIVRDSYGEVRSAAAESVLTLAPTPDGAARKLLEIGSSELVALVLQAWEHRDLAEVQEIVEGLLSHDNQMVRVKAVSYLIERFSPVQLEDVLDRYLEGFHYYNIVCWLDRALHAPSPLRELFLRRLRNEIGYRTRREW